MPKTKNTVITSLANSKKSIKMVLDEKRTLKSLISMEFFLFFLRKFSLIHALLEPPCLFISEKICHQYWFLWHKHYKNPNLHTITSTSVVIWLWTYILPTCYQNSMLIKDFRVPSLSENISFFISWNKLSDLTGNGRILDDM